LQAAAQTAAPSAAAVAEAERLFNDAVAASERGDFAAALTSFQASYQANPLPDVLYNIGMCHKALGDLPAALNTFRDYVAAMGGNLTPDERAEFDALLAELAPQVGRLDIQGPPPGTSVSIDDVAVGTTPLGVWVAVSPGAHRVAAARPGYSPFSSEIEVAAGQTLAVNAPLVALSGQDPDTSADEGGMSPWFWACVGVAGASALTMAITGGLTLKYNDDFDAGGRTDADLRDTAIALRTTTDVFLGIGLAAVVAGTVLFFVLPGEESEDEGGGVAVVPALGGLAVSW
jgi:hypothetical protein